MGNEKESSQLGVPFGTASHRLRKMIVFHLLQKLCEDFCFRCTRRIEAVDDLSIEHKRPWRGVDSALFWDLDNVAFSHVSCNKPSPDRHAGRARRKVGPPGTAWCYEHQAFLPVDEFGHNRTNWTGLSRQCKACHRDQERNRVLLMTKEQLDERRRQNREYMREYMRAYRNKYSGVAQ